MNERIKQLADRAEHYAKQQAGSDWEVEVPYSQKVFRQKFAELIVEEMYIFMCNATDNDKPWPRFKEVKQHFGVEE